MATGDTGVRATVRRVLALERDVLVLSAAMFAFSLGFQMTTRYMPRYVSVLGGGAVAIGLFKSLSDLLAAVYPYPGGGLSDRIGSRFALTLFGLLTTVGFVVWLAAPLFGTPEVAGVVLPVGIFLGLFLVQAWKSLGFAVYALFPVVLINAPADPLVIAGLFAFSGLRFAGLPAHKALIVGPAEAGAGGRVTGSYYLVRNTATNPSGVAGGVLYARSPTLAFTAATAVGLGGVGLFLAFGEEFDAAVAG